MLRGLQTKLLGKWVIVMTGELDSFYKTSHKRSNSNFKWVSVSICLFDVCLLVTSLVPSAHCCGFFSCCCCCTALARDHLWIKPCVQRCGVFFLALSMTFDFVFCGALFFVCAAMVVTTVHTTYPVLLSFILNIYPNCLCCLQICKKSLPVSQRIFPREELPNTWCLAAHKSIHTLAMGLNHIFCCIGERVATWTFI